jgi:hypothetical protein
MESYSQVRVVESEIYRPWRWVLPFLALAFCTASGIGMAVLALQPPPNLPTAVWPIVILVATLSVGLLAWSLWDALTPASIQHSDLGCLPDISDEPVLREGSMVHGTLTHELVETAVGFEFRPNPKVWRRYQTFILGFGAVFLPTLAGFLSWVFHKEHFPNSWATSIILAAGATLAAGGSAFGIFYYLFQTAHMRLPRLVIPHGEGAEMVLTTPEERFPSSKSKPASKSWSVEHLVAVQLCPWDFSFGSHSTSSSTLAVQGLLVLRAGPEAKFEREPILLTSDFVGAARLMKSLADALHVPYLFSGDAPGWEAEKIRAKTRPPLNAGGWIS